MKKLGFGASGRNFSTVKARAQQSLLVSHATTARGRRSGIGKGSTDGGLTVALGALCTGIKQEQPWGSVLSSALLARPLHTMSASAQHHSFFNSSRIHLRKIGENFGACCILSPGTCKAAVEQPLFKPSKWFGHSAKHIEVELKGHIHLKTYRNLPCFL